MQIMAVTPFDKRRSKVLISEDFAFVYIMERSEDIILKKGQN